MELEHGAVDPETNVTGDDLVLTGKIAWAHLKEIRDYYTRLDQMETEAEEQDKDLIEHQPPPSSDAHKARPRIIR